MPHAYTEDQLVEQPAIGLFAELGWQVALPHPHPGPLPFCEPSPQPLPRGEEMGEGVAGPPPTAGVVGEPREAGLLGRVATGEVVEVSRLSVALSRSDVGCGGHPALLPGGSTASRLIERLASELGKWFVGNGFLFEWKTSR